VPSPRERCRGGRPGFVQAAPAVRKLTALGLPRGILLAIHGPSPRAGCYLLFSLMTPGAVKSVQTER